MRLGTENRKQGTVAAIVLGVLGLLAIVGYEVMNTFSTNASTTNTPRNQSIPEADSR